MPRCKSLTKLRIKETKYSPVLYILWDFHFGLSDLMNGLCWLISEAAIVNLWRVFDILVLHYVLLMRYKLRSINMRIHTLREPLNLACKLRFSHEAANTC